MGRKNRSIVDGGTYSIKNTINEEQNLLKPAAIKKLFLKVIYEAKRKYKFKLKNIRITDNQIQMIIKMYKGENLSKLMQWILSVFAMRYNRSHNRKGHLWIGRFISNIIENITAYIKTFEEFCVTSIERKNEDYNFNHYMFLRFFKKSFSP